MATDAETLSTRADTRRRWALALPAVTIISLFSILPLGVVVVYSFLTPGDYGNVKWVFSLEGWFQVLFERDIFDDTVTLSDAHISILVRSVLLSLATTVITLILGVPTAWLIATRPQRQRAFWLFLITIVKVTLTEYDSNETAMAKIEAGGHGFDIVVPSALVVPIYIEKGLLLKSDPNQMENFKNVAPEWASVAWDPDRSYTVPWVWGTTGIMVNKDVYSGDINTSAIFLDPPEELKGKINVVPSMNDVIDLAIMYVGGQPCTTDKEVLKAARDKLVAAKPHWASIDYASFEKFINEDLQASVFWSGAAMRIRAENSGFTYGFPKEGFLKWQDNVAILADAQNVENAKLFLNFIMDPENAAMISNYTGYGNGIAGSEAFLTADLLASPEMTIPETAAPVARFQQTCPPEVQELYSRIWSDLTK